jgi:hypothetical protein
MDYLYFKNIIVKIIKLTIVDGSTSFFFFSFFLQKRNLLKKNYVKRVFFLECANCKLVVANWQCRTELALTQKLFYTLSIYFIILYCWQSGPCPCGTACMFIAACRRLVAASMGPHIFDDRLTVSHTTDGFHVFSSCPTDLELCFYNYQLLC